MTVEEAKLLDLWFSKEYNGVASLGGMALDEVKKKGYTQSIFGHRRYFHKYFTGDMQSIGEVEREGGNSYIQMPAAAIMKIGLRRVWEALRATRLKARLVLTVHDELVLETPDAEVEQVKAICENMTSGLLELPLPVEVTIKTHW